MNITTLQDRLESYRAEVSRINTMLDSSVDKIQKFYQAGRRDMLTAVIESMEKEDILTQKVYWLRWVTPEGKEAYMKDRRVSVINRKAEELRQKLCVNLSIEKVVWNDHC